MIKGIRGKKILRVIKAKKDKADDLHLFFFSTDVCVCVCVRVQVFIIMCILDACSCTVFLTIVLF